ncbi:hypothetical protein JIX56_25930 [Streptomyces sp. CA-210063]|uniref:hypothetical protein n=1 Tax=Streptomyces sp. CA-210063 TaxID=2801029 RepID=UPI00214BE83E|nr:hypothetical protein [Streptomyces sp. CA-210063]UUU33034.1 hypothetical protein JIX56_25930 [Streptomyces sp. CA-210063]
MRIRATVAAVSGALALSAFAVPAAQADGSAVPDWQAVSAGAGQSAFGAATAADADVATLDVSFSGMKVNNGKAIVVGTKKVSVPVTYTLKHAAGVDVTSENFLNGPFLYLKSLPTSVGQAFTDPVLFGDEPATCKATSATTASCKALIDIRPAAGDLLNSGAATWKAGALAIQADDSSGELTGEKWQGKLGTSKLQRHSKLTGTNASPEPVKKGKTLTVTSKLTRVNWETEKYAGYGGQSVKLQFKKKGTSVYKDVKTVKTSSTGVLKTTVKATVDGTYRYVFSGSASTAAVTAAADAVDVK